MVQGCYYFFTQISKHPAGFPQHISVSKTGIAWVGSGIQCRQPQSDLSKWRGCTRIQYYSKDSNQRIVVPETRALLEDAEDGFDSITQSSPSTCGRWLTFEEYDEVREYATIVLVDLEINSVEYLAERKLSTRSSFAPQLLESTDWNGEFFNSDEPLRSKVECTLIWAETYNNLTVTESG